MLGSRVRGTGPLVRPTLRPRPRWLGSRKAYISSTFQGPSEGLRLSGGLAFSKWKQTKLISFSVSNKGISLAD